MTEVTNDATDGRTDGQAAEFHVCRRTDARNSVAYKLTTDIWIIFRVALKFKDNLISSIISILVAETGKINSKHFWRENSNVKFKRFNCNFSLRHLNFQAKNSHFNF